MRRRIVTAVVLCLATVVTAPAYAIVGGNPVGPTPGTQINAVGSIQQPQGSHICGAALIRPTWMVTAAHCLTKYEPAMVQVRIGSEDRTTGGTLAFVDKVVPHPTADIALVRLTTSVPNRLLTIPDFQPKADVPVELIGWGKTATDATDFSRTAQRLDTKITDTTNCKDINPDTELCVHNPTNAGPCAGDDGDPAITPAFGLESYLTGIVVRYDGKCGASPAVLVNVPKLRDWIDQNTGTP